MQRYQQICSIRFYSRRQRTSFKAYCPSWRVNGRKVRSVATPMRCITALNTGMTQYSVLRRARIARTISLSRNEMNTLCKSRELNFHRYRRNVYATDARIMHRLACNAHPRVPLFLPWLIRWKRNFNFNLYGARNRQRKFFQWAFNAKHSHAILLEF